MAFVFWLIPDLLWKLVFSCVSLKLCFLLFSQLYNFLTCPHCFHLFIVSPSPSSQLCLSVSSVPCLYIELPLALSFVQSSCWILSSITCVTHFFSLFCSSGLCSLLTVLELFALHKYIWHSRSGWCWFFRKITYFFAMFWALGCKQ